MVDIPGLPEELEEFSDSLGSRALERAFAGQRWLDAHAPADWRLNMVSILDGTVTSHVQVSVEDQGPLALAFRKDATLLHFDGRVTSGAVSVKFNLSPEELERFGFQAKEAYPVAGAWVISSYLDVLLLDWAWGKVLGALDWHPQTAALHTEEMPRSAVTLEAEETPHSAVTRGTERANDRSQLEAWHFGGPDYRGSGP